MPLRLVPGNTRIPFMRLARIRTPISLVLIVISFVLLFTVGLNQGIDFVGGIRGTEELVRRVDSGKAAVAFSMYPTTLGELMAIADAGATMPPKSTWFEPKLRSGLFVHRF